MSLLGSLVDLWVRIPLLIWSFYAQWFWLCDKLVILFVFSQYNLSCEKRINSITESSSFISWVIECVMRLCYPVWYRWQYILTRRNQPNEMDTECIKYKEFSSEVQTCRSLIVIGVALYSAIFIQLYIIIIVEFRQWFRH